MKPILCFETVYFSAIALVTKYWVLAKFSVTYFLKVNSAGTNAGHSLLNINLSLVL